MIKNYFKKRVFHILSGIIGLVITIVLLFDNLLILIKYNEYGWHGIILFTLICAVTFLSAFLVSEILMFIAFLIYKKSKKGSNK